MRYPSCPGTQVLIYEHLTYQRFAYSPEVGDSADIGVSVIP